MSHAILPLLPSEGFLMSLAEYLTDHGWTCLPPGTLADPTPEEELTRRRARRDDHATSKAGAAAVAPRAGSQRAHLLAMYERNHWREEGLTDEEAAERAGLLGSCYWKRCGELRDEGWIEVVRDSDGTPVTRLGSAGSPRFASRITAAGRALHATLNP